MTATPLFAFNYKESSLQSFHRISSSTPFQGKILKNTAFFHICNTMLKFQHLTGNKLLSAQLALKKVNEV